MADSHKGAAVAVATIVALVLGGGVGYAVGTNMGNESTDGSMNSSMQNSKSDNSDGVTVGGAKMVRTKDIVDNAAAASNVKTVVSLVQLAGLVDTLKSEGPFTVFGPNDGAFAKLDKATVESRQQKKHRGVATCRRSFIRYSHALVIVPVPVLYRDRQSTVA